MEPTNYNRYVYADAEDLERNRLKTNVVATMLRERRGVVVNEHPHAFGEVVAQLPAECFAYVIAAVHSREARREIQFETPMVLWDGAAAGDGEFRIWRLMFGKTECMHCKHPPAEDPEVAKSHQLSIELGLQPAFWLRKIRNNEPFGASEIRSLRRPQEAEYALPVEGQRFDEWVAAQCGLLHLPDSDTAVPIPFAPVMAGVLLAGEVVKQRHFPDAVLDSYYWNTLMGRFMVRNRPWRREALPECGFCHDPIYLAQYERRWGSRLA